MKRTEFAGYVYDFSADYNYIGVDDIEDIHKYLMEKNGIVWLYLSFKKLVIIQNGNIKANWY